MKIFKIKESNFYKENGILENHKTKTDDKHIQIETIDIPKIEIKIGKDYTHKIPGDVKLIIIYIAKKDETRDKLNNLYVGNIAKAIGEFQKTYDVIPYHNNRGLFGGIKKDSEILVAFYKEGFAYHKRYKPEDVYPVINLSKDKPLLNNFRTELLKKSKQSHFDYSFFGDRKKAYKIFWSVYGFEIQWNWQLQDKDKTFNFWFEIDYFRIKIDYNYADENPVYDSTLVGTNE